MEEKILSNLDYSRIAVVIPAYRVERQIKQVLNTIPPFIDDIVVVNDCSPDQTRETVLSISDPRIHLLTHTHNMGVGGAMLTGYSYALQLDADIVIKVDGDGQMDLRYLSMLLNPILEGKADYSKGNRFLHPLALKRMPIIRKFANLGITFLTKLASGYWNIFDPANGYTAISSEKLQNLDPKRIAKDYFFETSMLCELRKFNAVVEDVSIPAKYEDEQSSVIIGREIFVFSKNLFKRTIHRLFYSYFLYDFNAVSFYLLSSFVLGLFGVIWTIIKWSHSAQTGIPSTTGTVLIAVLPLILAVQFFIQAIAQDIAELPNYVQHTRNFKALAENDDFYPLQGYFQNELASGNVIEESHSIN